MARLASFFGMGRLKETRQWTVDECIEAYLGVVEGLEAVEGTIKLAMLGGGD